MRRIGSLVSRNLRAVIGCLIISAASYSTYVPGYEQTSYLYWDESYHVIYAQRYLHDIYFMQAHPPLGKLFIALGELLVDDDPDDGFYAREERIKEQPKRTPMAGYRLFPTIFAWLTAPLIFCFVYLIWAEIPIAFLVSGLYTFDNALIVHGRPAILDSTLLFGMMGYLLLLAVLHRMRPGGTARLGILAGVGALLGWCFTTKLTGLFLILAIPPVLLTPSSQLRPLLRDLAVIAAAFTIVFVFVWRLHFAFGQRVESALPEAGWFRSGERTKVWVNEGMPLSVPGFAAAVMDNYRFIFKDHAGVPKLDLCKHDENGSPFYLWPFGGRAINYRWERVTPVDFKYYYLQANPLVWAVGLLGIVLTAARFLFAIFFAERFTVGREDLWPALLLFMWISYMIAMSRLDRVMYLYHYFPALLLSFMLAGDALARLRRAGTREVTDRHRAIVTALILFGAWRMYEMYSPLTYFEPIDNASFQKFTLVDYWGLRCIGCERTPPW